MPRGAGAGLKPARPGVAQSSRSTQRIVLPTMPGGAKPGVNSTKPLSMPAPTGRINLPIGMILRCLPPEVLAADLSEFEASGAAATEVGLPMNLILGQLPSGKVEIALQDLVAHFPAGYLQPTESITSYLPNLINLPLMDVVMRIPPDLLALRPDQKDVDSAVINMADPFTEEILREQAEAARRAAAQTNIIDESQVPQTEEFVPSTPKAATPPPRPPSVPLPVPPAPPAPPVAAAPAAPPMPPVNKLPTATGSLRTNSPVPPSAPPTTTGRMISPSGRLPSPTRATTPIPTRPPAAVNAPITPTSTLPASQPTVPLPMPRQSAPAPAPAAPPPAPAPAPVATPPPTVALPPVAEVPAPVAPPAPAPEPPPVTAPDQASELQRLAALAMQQEEEEPVPAPEPEPVAPPVPEPVAVAPEPEPIPEPAPIVEAPPVAEPEPVAAIAPPVPIAPPPVPVAPPPVPVAPPVPVIAPAPPPAPAPVAASRAPTAPVPAVAQAPAPSAGAVAINLNRCTVDDLAQIPGCSRELSESIVQYRTKIGSFRKIESLLEVPGMTAAAYTILTGEAPPEGGAIPGSLNELLGFPAEQNVSLKDVTDRIACWPDVTGCVLSQKSGLSLVGHVPSGLDKAAIVAFAPRMFESLNKSFGEITGKETDELNIPTPGTSFHIYRNGDLYLIILARVPQMPDRHSKVARLVLNALVGRQN